jgi:hypothetical protein
MRACHAFADWSVFPQWKVCRFSIMFICNWHREQMQKPIPGIDRPPYADEFWKPSIKDCVRLALIRLNHEDRRKEVKEVEDSQAENYRDERYTPRQLKQILVLRSHLR